jgi:hypothetical protein
MMISAFVGLQYLNCHLCGPTDVYPSIVFEDSICILRSNLFVVLGGDFC